LQLGISSDGIPLVEAELEDCDPAELADLGPPPGAVVLGIHDDGVPIGICTVFPDVRLVDGPGVCRSHRTPDAYVRLLDGACALLGDGPIDLDSWGDAAEVIEAYERRGFQTVESIGGWKLQL
jgi:hypothetical protein